LLTAAAGVRCGRENPAAPARAAAVAPAATADDAQVAARAPITKQRWIVTDACDDRKGIRVRLLDFTDHASQYPRGFWRVPVGASINRVIECQTGHQICLGGVQDPPPGIVWGVGMRGERFPCKTPGKCCFRCDAYAHHLTLSCTSSTQRSVLGGSELGEADGAIEDAAELEIE
jgi:hypothetical protein